MPSLSTILPFLLTLSTTTITTTAHGSTLPQTPRCTPINLLINPSFESSSTDISPWLSLATGSFSTRHLISGGHNTPTAYFAASNSSTDTLSTLTLSQSYFSAPVGRTAECYAWVKAGKRETGTTRVQIFLDGASCGGEVELGADGKEEWTRVGGEVVVRDVGSGEVGHTVAVTVQGYGVERSEGWNVTIDDIGVEVGC